MALTEVRLPPPFPTGDNTVVVNAFINGTTPEIAAYVKSITPPEWHDLFLARACPDGSLPPLADCRVIIDGDYKTEGVRQPHPAVGYVVRGAVQLSRDVVGNTFEADNGSSFFAETDGPGDPLNEDGQINSGKGDGTVPRVNRSRAIFDIEGAGNTLIGITARGSRKGGAVQWDLEAQHGWNHKGDEATTLIDCAAVDCHGDGFYGGAGSGKGTKLQSRNVTLRRPTVRNVGRQAFAPCFFDDWYIDHPTVDGCKRQALNPEPIGQGSISRRLYMGHGTFRDIGGMFIASKGASVPVDDVRIEWNRVYGKPLQIRVQDPGGTDIANRRWSILANESDTEARWGDLMWFVRAAELTVAFNRQPYSLAWLREKDPNRLRRGDVGLIGLWSCDLASVNVGWNDRGGDEENRLIPEWRDLTGT